MKKIAIIGNGMFGNIGALYLRRRLPPNVEIMVIGPETRRGMPVVGESTIEITAQFLENELGLGPYLREHHYPKYALTYYFKLDPSSSRDRRYSVHCNEREPDDYPALEGGWDGPMARPPSWQLNREVFDRDMRARVDADGGIERVVGLVRDIELDGQDGHALDVELAAGGRRRVSADWIIDASGRRALLSRKLGLKVRSKVQRNAFWFRLSDFDRSKLGDLDALGPEPPGPGSSYHYDRYYSTHHFMGAGNWIWMIPLRSEQRQDLMSIGISMRPDIYRGSIRGMDDFIEQTEAVHPVVTDLVRSGRTLDTNIYRHYHYHSKQAYSANRWAIIGDAAYAPDPLFSNGLAFGVIQLEQLGEMIVRDVAGEHDPELIQRLDRAFWAPVVSSQEAIANWYTTMDDAFISSLRLNWIEIAYFYLLLPLVRNRAHFDPKMIDAWKVLELRGSDQASSTFDLPRELVQARALFDRVRPEHFIYRGKVKVNPRAMARVDGIDQLYAQMSAGSRVRRKYTADAVARVRLAESLPSTHQPRVSM